MGASINNARKTGHKSSRKGQTGNICPRASWKVNLAVDELVDQWGFDLIIFSSVAQYFNCHALSSDVFWYCGYSCYSEIFFFLNYRSLYTKLKFVWIVMKAVKCMFFFCFFFYFYKCFIYLKKRFHKWTHNTLNIWNKVVELTQSIQNMARRKILILDKNNNNNKKGVLNCSLSGWQSG